MFKKLVSLTLVGLMSISMLTGCGVNELGYLNLSKELSNVTEFSFENSTQIEFLEEILGEEYIIDLGLNGVANLEDLESMYMSFDLLVKINDIEIKKPMNFKIVDNNVYLSTNALLEVVALEEAFNGTTKSEKVIEELYNNDLKDVEYILLSDLGFEYENISYKEMSDSAMKYLTKTFKGLDSKLITKTSKGYSIELTSESALVFVKNLITYLSENKELVFEETVKYLENLYSSIKIEGVTEEDIAEMIVELKEGKQEFYDFIDGAVLIAESGELDSYSDMVKGSKIKDEIYKERNRYKEISEVELVYEELNSFKIKSNTTITPKKVEKTVITDSIMAEDLEVLYNKAENKVNPIKEMELSWADGDVEAFIINTRLDENDDIDEQPYTIIDGRIYLPLRYICETFGEEVLWDDAIKSAYIVRGSEKTSMTGVLLDSKTMIKVRDFEKLGYKVEFEKKDGLSIVTIIK